MPSDMVERKKSDLVDGVIVVRTFKKSFVSWNSLLQNSHKIIALETFHGHIYKMSKKNLDQLLVF